MLFSPLLWVFVSFCWSSINEEIFSNFWWFVTFILTQVFSLVSCCLCRIFVVLILVEFSPDFCRQVFSIVSCHLSRVSWFWVFLFCCFWSRFLLHQKVLKTSVKVFVSSTILEHLFVLRILFPIALGLLVPEVCLPHWDLLFQKDIFFFEVFCLIEVFGKLLIFLYWILDIFYSTFLCALFYHSAFLYFPRVKKWVHVFLFFNWDYFWLKVLASCGLPLRFLVAA